MPSKQEAIHTGPLSTPTYPTLSAEQRWDISLSNRERILRRLFDHKYMRLTGLVTLSAVAGIAARHSQLDQGDFVEALQNFASERFTGLAGIDTGPTVADNVVLEGASSLLFKFAGLYGATMIGFDTFSKRTDRLSGRAEVPKNWEDHRIIIDPYRLVFDAVANTTDLDKNPIVLIHGGDIYNPDGKTLVGGQLTYKNQRHINALSIEHISDLEVLRRAHPYKAREVVINLWNPNRALYDREVDEGLSPAKAHNILLTLENSWPGISTTVLAPRSTQESLELAKLSNVLHPEDIVAEFIASSLAESKDQIVSVVSSIEGVKEGLGEDLRSRNLDTSEEIDNATIAFVYEATDDMTIMRAHRLLAENPDIHVVPMIEREANIDEAAKLSLERGSVIFIPHIIAQRIAA